MLAVAEPCLWRCSALRMFWASPRTRQLRGSAGTSRIDGGIELPNVGHEALKATLYIESVAESLGYEVGKGATLPCTQAGRFFKGVRGKLYYDLLHLRPPLHSLQTWPKLNRAGAWCQVVV